MSSCSSSKAKGCNRRLFIFLNGCVMAQEISETKRIAHMEKTDIDHRLKDHYEQQMKDNLRELRENHEEQLRISRKEIEEKYQDLQDELQRKLDLLMSSTNSTTEEMHTYKTRADNIASQMDDLKAQLESMKNRKKDLEKMLEQEREWHRNALRNKDNEIRQLTEQLNRQLKEFHDVLDTNVGINSELAVYEKLLEAEECRLNLSKEDSLSGTTPTRRGAPSRKRKRVVQMEEEESQKEQSSSGGLLEIVDQDPQGSYIKIHNRSSQEMPLGGYVLVRESGEDNSCRYKFTRHVNIKPKSDITVWSHSSGKTHNPAAGDLVMKVGMNWPTGDVVTTALLNPAGEEMAARSMSKRSHTSRQDSSSHDLRLVEDDQ
ncbi:LMNB1, partial [Cordylochernes scorpioides]